MHPPHTQGNVQSAVRLALSGMYLLQASARTGLIDCQMISNVPEELILPIITGFDSLTVHSLSDRINVGGAGLGDGLRPLRP